MRSYIVFLSVFVGILTLGAGYVLRRWLGTFGIWPKSTWFWLVAPGFAGFELLALWLYRKFEAHPWLMHRPMLLQWAAYIALGLFAAFVLYTLMLDLLLLGPRMAGLLTVGFDRWAFSILGLWIFLSMSFGLVRAMDGVRVVETDVFLPGLPSKFEGYRIAHVSDLHIGPLINRAIATRIAEKIGQISPDAVALVGDLMDGTPDFLLHDLEPIKALKNRDGIFFVTGNHEYFSGVEAWLKVFRGWGWQVLLNEHRVIARENDRLVIAGVTDRSGGQHSEAHRPDYRKALLNMPAGAPRIMLAHQTLQADQALEAGADVVLCGHTHGGQFFPWKMIVAATQPYYWGRYEPKPGRWVVTSAGAGFWGPPFRFLAPPEIVVVRLKKRG